MGFCDFCWFDVGGVYFLVEGQYFGRDMGGFGEVGDGFVIGWVEISGYCCDGCVFVFVGIRQVVGVMYYFSGIVGGVFYFIFF